MDEKRLMEEVLRELMDKLKREEPFQEEAPRAMVIGTLPAEEEKTLRAGYQLISFLEQEEWDVLILAQLPLKLMVNLALGNPDGEEASCILQALLAGRKVYLLESGMVYRQYRESAYKPLYLLYQEYEEKLRRFGAEVISHTVDLRKNRETSSKEHRNAAYIDLKALRLLRESDVIKARNQGIVQILLGRKTIITPLASDYITNHNLAVRRE